MPQLLATPLLTVAYAANIGPVVATLTVGNALMTSSMVAASPAEGLVIGGGPRMRTSSRPVAPKPLPSLPLHTDEHRRDLLLASSIGLQTAIRYGPRSYVGISHGVCMEPEVAAGAPLLIDPDAEPEPGDMVVIWTRDDRHIACRNERGRQVLLDDVDMLDPDEQVRDMLSTHHVARAGCWAYGKRLVRPLPPRSTWADDTNYSLVVDTLNPAIEYRSHLAEVLSIDKVLAVLDFSGAAG